MRNQGWEKELDLYIRDIAQKDFGWGSCDCLLFVSDASYLLCGIDPMSKKLDGDPETIRGRYKTRNEAARLIRRHRKSMRNIMDIHFRAIKPAFAQRGDIVMADLNEGETFGLAVAGRAFFKTETLGFITKPLNECRLAWRVEKCLQS